MILKKLYQILLSVFKKEKVKELPTYPSTLSPSEVVFIDYTDGQETVLQTIQAISYKYYQKEHPGNRVQMINLILKDNYLNDFMDTLILQYKEGEIIYEKYFYDLKLVQIKGGLTIDDLVHEEFYTYKFSSMSHWENVTQGE